MSEATNQPPTTGEKFVDLVGYSSAALEKAEQFIKQAEAVQAEVASLIPACVDEMDQNQRVEHDQREKLAEILTKPVEVIKLLTKVAGHRNRDELAHLGQGVNGNGQTKTAGDNGSSYNSLTSPHVGAHTSRVAQSTVNLYRGLGLAPPTE